MELEYSRNQVHSRLIGKWSLNRSRRHKSCLAGREAPLVEKLLAGIFRIYAGPMNASIGNPVVGHSSIDIDKVGDLFHHLFRAGISHRGFAHERGKGREDFQIALASGRLKRRAQTLYEPVRAGIGPDLLGKGGHRQDRVSHFGSRSDE